MDPYFHIHRPTLILNEDRTRRNIRGMVAKAKANRVRLRPHFKTHQSAAIGEWFREEGIDAITVSSLSMAAYFASQGWEDITVAFPFNLREIEKVWELSSKTHLELLVESTEVVDFLDKQFPRDLDLWIKIDAGGNRTGIPASNTATVTHLVSMIKGSNHLNFKGILSHFGQTYNASSRDEAARLYFDGVARMGSVRAALRKAGYRKTLISVGDTPGCCTCEDLRGVDEIRPGNFVFFDATQLRIGSCLEEDIAIAVACPVVSRHPDRNEVILYGGAVHLSKEYLLDNGTASYGDVAFPSSDGWTERIPGAYVRSLSQEHGIVHLPKAALDRVRVGDILMVLPVHSCLAVAALGEYITLEGERIGTMISRSEDQAEGNGGEGYQEEDDAKDADHLPVF